MKSAYFFLLTVVFILLSCKSQLNYSIHHTDLPKVSLEPYESVQKRDLDTQDSSLALGVSIAGGGSRAQYYGLGVLMGLEEITEGSGRNFLTDIDYFSTVSGGSYAAGYYLTIRKNVLSKYPSFNNNFNHYWRSTARIDSLQEFIHKSASPLGIFVMGYHERNRLLVNTLPERIDYQVLQYEKPFKNSTIERITLNDFFVAKGTRTPELPMFVANGTIYHSVERLPFMPHILEEVRIMRSMLPNENLANSNGHSNGYNLPLTYAVTGSSGFPGVLPMLKFAVEDPHAEIDLKKCDNSKAAKKRKKKQQVIRVMDGGVVENLGYTTLIELLAADKSVKKENKRALIIDCSSIGQSERTADNERLSWPKILQPSIFFTLSSKYPNIDEDIQGNLLRYDIPINNYERLGITSIRDSLQKIENNCELERAVSKYDGLKDSDRVYRQMFADFEDRIKEYVDRKEINPIKVLRSHATNYGDNNLRLIDLIPTAQFEKLSPADVFLLYELASRVNTKLKIYRIEKSILVLAGRYTVYLKQKQIKKLYLTR